jgi:hypothetical protein
VFVVAVIVCSFAGTMGLFYLLGRNNLGLTRFDAMIGGFPNIATLRANAEAAADSFLAQHRDELGVKSRSDPLTVEYAMVEKVRRFGYKSSFYYYGWDIYLPYSLRPPSGKPTTVVAHVSDAVHGNSHNPQKFRVIDARLLAEHGETITTVAGR